MTVSAAAARSAVVVLATVLASILVGLAASTGAAVAVPTEAPVVLDEGLVAFEVAGPEVAVRHEHEAWPQVTVRADGDLARQQLPATLPQGYAGLVTPGATVFQLAGTGAPGLPTVGWSAAASAAPVTLEVTATGPGRVLALDDRGDAGVVVHLDSAAAASSPVPLEPAAAATPTWVFERPGSYTLTARSTVHEPSGDMVGAEARVEVLVTEPTPTPTPAPAAPVAPVAPVAPAQVEADGCAVPGLAAGAITASTGHFDFGVQVEGGQLRSRVKDDQTSPPTWRDPASVLFQLGDAARMTVPAGSAYSFLGAAGTTVWTIGQTQQDGVPWLGWNTQHPSAVEAIDGPTTWTLDGVEGPGELFVHQTGSFGTPTRVLGSAAGWPTSMRIPANVHGHGNWSFTQPGLYRIATTHSATLRSGARVSASSTLFVQVGPCASADPAPTGRLDAGRLLAADALVGTPRAGVRVEPRQVRPGQRVTVTVPGAEPGAWLMPVAYSTPRQLGWTQVSATGQLPAVRLPEKLAAGAHQVAVYDRDGAVRGWAPVSVATAGDGPTEPPATPPATDQPAPPTQPDPPEQSGGQSTASPALPGTAPARTPARCVPRPSTPPTPATPATPAEPDPAPAATDVTDGHLDLGARIADGALVPLVKDDRQQPPAWVDPATVRLVLGDAAEQQVPADPAYSFMGEPGATVWMMPQTQVSGIPWLGWNTQDESVRAQVDESVRFTLDGVEGPGELAVYLTDSFGGIGEKTFGSAPGFPSTFEVPVNVHAHGNWVFTEPGSYSVTLTQSARLTSGAEVSGTATLAFTVGTAGTARVLPRVAPGFAAAAPTAAERLDDCVLPETGASRATAVLLPIGVLLVLAGTATLVGRRRA